MTPLATLAVELVTEELPPKALKALGEAFATALTAELAARGYVGAESVTTTFATPRRLAATVTHVLAVAPDNEVLDKLMPAKVALDSAGAPSQAFVRKLTGLGRPELATRTLDAMIGPDRVFVRSDGKADYVYLQSLAKGQPLARGLQEALTATIEKLPIPKVMRYANPSGGYFNDTAFVRPARRLLALHGTAVVPVSVLGLVAGRKSAGHRFLSRGEIDVASADAWLPTLTAEGRVMPSFRQRREAIETALAKAVQGDVLVAPDALLDEVTALVEWPAVYAGWFDRAFLDVPQECLILTMQQNQKYFALTDADGRMRARFLVVSNLAIEDPRAIVAGNERVLRARLADAKFFFDQDRKASLESRLPRLASVVYLAKLGARGSQLDRVARIRALACDLASATGAAPDRADRAALLAKADLSTDMVGEFPELQGTMGRYYAQHDGEAPEVADAIAQHYGPRFAGDALPVGPVAQAVALADKLEALAGLFGTGQVPTGDKDPFGLRRAAIGVVRIVIEKHIELPLSELIDRAFRVFEGIEGFRPAPAELLAFIAERLRGYLREQGGSANQVEAVLAAGLGSLVSLPPRLAAVREFELMAEAPALAAANKRIVNILRKSGADAASGVDRAKLEDPAERDLYAAIEALEPVVEARCALGDWTGALRALASARPAVDRFFDGVMVMTDDASIRGNRLALLRRAATAMNRVADISKLAS